MVVSRPRRRDRSTRRPPLGSRCSVRHRMPIPLAVTRVSRRIAGPAVVALVLAGSLAPSHVAEAARPDRERAGRQRSEAQRIDRADVRPGDRTVLGALPDRARVAYHPATGRVRFLAGTHASPLAGRPAGVAAGVTGIGKADAIAIAGRFVRGNARLFGAADAGRDLRVSPGRTRLATARRDASVVRFEQVRAGIPVLGGELAVRLSPRGDVLSVSGELSPSVGRVATTPSVSASAAERLAALSLARARGRSPAAVHADRTASPSTTRASSAGLRPWARRGLAARASSGESTPASTQAAIDPASAASCSSTHGVAWSWRSIARDADVIRRVCDARNRQVGQVRLQEAVRAVGRPARERRRRCRQRVPPDGCRRRVVPIAVRAQRHRRPWRADEGHRPLLLAPVVLSLEQRPVAVGRPGGGVRSWLGEGGRHRRSRVHARRPRPRSAAVLPLPVGCAQRIAR